MGNWGYPFPPFGLPDFLGQVNIKGFMNEVGFFMGASLVTVTLHSGAIGIDQCGVVLFITFFLGD